MKPKINTTRLSEKRGEQLFDDCSPLSPAEIRELLRRKRDSDDRTRFLLVSSFGPGFNLYYDISEDNYIFNEPNAATLFKRRNMAVAVKRLIGKHVRIQACRVNRQGKLVLRSLSKTDGRKKG